MKFQQLKFTLFAIAILPFAACPAAAAEPICKGQLAMIRVSTLKSPESRPLFDKAVADQIAWYRGHGLMTNTIVTADVIDYAGKLAISNTEIVTIHYDPPAAANRQPAPDEAYAAFIKEFQNSSDIVTQKLVCLPK